MIKYKFALHYVILPFFIYVSCFIIVLLQYLCDIYIYILLEVQLVLSLQESIKRVSNLYNVFGFKLKITTKLFSLKVDIASYILNN